MTETTPRGGTLPTDGMPGRRGRSEQTLAVAASLAEQSRAAAASTETINAASVANLPTAPHASFYPDEHQVRTHFTDADLDALGANIVRQGLRDPLKVYPRDSRGYMIHDGERRWRAIGRMIETAKLPGDFAIPFLLVTPIEREERGRADTTAHQLATSIHKERYTPLETVVAFAQLADSVPGRSLLAAEVSESFGFPRDLVEKNLRVGHELTREEIDTLKKAWPTVALDPLEKFVAWLEGAREEVRAEAFRVFIRRKPTAKLVDATLRHLAPPRQRGRPPQKKFSAGLVADGGFAVSLTIPVNRVRDPEVLAAARRDLEGALQKLGEMEAEAGTSAGQGRA